MRTYDEASFKTRIARLHADARVTFAAACATRLLPLYVRFCEKTRSGDPHGLGEAMRAVWDWVRGIRKDPGFYAVLAESLDSHLPEEDEGIPPGSWAMDALSSAIYTLQSVADPDPRQIVWAAGRMIDAVGDFIRFEWVTKGRGLPSAQAGFSDPVMQAVLNQFERDLTDLENLGPETLPAEVDRLKKRAEGECPIPA